MAKAGRKSGFNERMLETIVRLSKEGKTLEQVAEVIGVSSRTITNWMGKHQELFLAIREARFVADELVEASLFARATGYSHPEQKVFCTKDGAIITHDMQKHYPPDTQAAVFWLRNRQPDRWKEKTEGDVTVNNNLSVENLTDDQLNARIEKYIAKSKVKKE